MTYDVRFTSAALECCWPSDRTTAVAGEIECQAERNVPTLTLQDKAIMRSIPYSLIALTIVLMNQARTVGADNEAEVDSVEQPPLLGFATDEWQRWRHKMDELDIDPTIAAQVVIETFRTKGLVDDNMVVENILLRSVPRDAALVATVSGATNSETCTTPMWIAYWVIHFNAIVVLVIGIRTCSKQLWLWSKTSRVLEASVYVLGLVAIASFFFPSFSDFDGEFDFHLTMVGLYGELASSIVLLIAAFMPIRHWFLRLSQEDSLPRPEEP